eukprot:TRINITY_DN18962_c0_g1_i2.p1 TRINITY_DN18962_c0_g1~~TRINITY_DN18962_c0_g1_i2.p1  ORF type:complete len:1230 (+),score=200.10 TRINITY_DN18962_c0_g1_i2:48-3692(+)
MACQVSRDLDLAFVVDETGSMGPYIGQVKENIINIITCVLQDPSVESFRVAVIGFRDHPPQEKSFVTRVTPFTDDISEITTAVKQMEARGGGDGPECVTDGLRELTALDWRIGAAKVAVLIGDAPPHGAGEPGDGFPNGCPCGERWEAHASWCGEMGVRVHALACVDTSDTAWKVFRRVAALAHGHCVHLSKVDHLVPLITQSSKDELALQVAKERLVTSVHEHSDQLRALPTLEARLAALTALLAAAGIQAPMLTYASEKAHGNPVVTTQREFSDTEVKHLVSSLLAAKAIPPGLFDSLESADLRTGMRVKSTHRMVPLTDVVIDAVVTFGAARVDVTQKFLNKGEEALEIVYYVPKDPNAVVAKLEFAIGDRVIVAKSMEKEAARDTYDDAIAQGKTAVLSCLLDEGAVRLDLGLLPPHTAASVKLSLALPLPVVDGSLVLRIPTTFAPVVFTADSALDARTIPATVPYGLRVTVTAYQQGRLGDVSVSHPKATVNAGDECIVVSYEAEDMGLHGDFVVEYRTRDFSTFSSHGFSVATLCPEKPQQLAVLSYVAPPDLKEGRAAKATSPVRIAIVVDSSVSMCNVAKLATETAIAMVQTVASRFCSSEVLVARFGSDTQLFRPRYEALTPATVTAASEWLYATGDQHLGGTDTKRLWDTVIVSATRRCGEITVPQHAHTLRFDPDRTKCWDKDCQRNVSGVWRCEQCQGYALCDGCCQHHLGTMRQVTIHPHPLGRSQAKSDWTCDASDLSEGCASGITTFGGWQAQGRWQCKQCDYDLCTKCAEKHAASTPPLLVILITDGAFDESAAPCVDNCTVVPVAVGTEVVPRSLLDLARKAGAGQPEWILHVENAVTVAQRSVSRFSRIPGSSVTLCASAQGWVCTHIASRNAKRNLFPGTLSQPCYTLWKWQGEGALPLRPPEIQFSWDGVAQAAHAPVSAPAAFMLHSLVVGNCVEDLEELSITNAAIALAVAYNIQTQLTDFVAVDTVTGPLPVSGPLKILDIQAQVKRLAGEDEERGESEFGRDATKRKRRVRAVCRDRSRDRSRDREEGPKKRARDKSRSPEKESKFGLLAARREGHIRFHGGRGGGRGYREDERKTREEKRAVHSATPVTTTSESSISAILSRQQNSGAWSIQAAIFTLLQCVMPCLTRARVQAEHPLTEEWFTAIILAVIIKHGTASEKLQHAIKRAEEFLVSEGATDLKRKAALFIV